jgi:hypothetical protein
MPPREEKDYNDAADDAPTACQGMPFFSCFVRRDGEEDGDAGNRIDDNEELNYKNSKKLK